MVRKASGPKGRRQRIQRHKIRANKSKGELPTEASAGKISKAGKTMKEYVTRVCTLFCLVPFTQPPKPMTGIRHQQYQLAPRSKRIFHYILISCFVSFTMYKFAVIVYLLIYSEVNTVFVMCFCSMLLLLLSITAAITSTTSRPFETLHLLSSCDSLGERLYELTGKRVQVFSSVPFCLKVICVGWLAHCAPINAAALSLVFDDLPVCVLPIVKWLGSISTTGSLPTIYWQIAFYPFEVLTLLPMMMVVAFNLYTFLLSMTMLKLCADQIRTIHLVGADSWRTVEGSYNCLRLHSTIFLSWMRYGVPLPIFFVACAVTVLMYVTFRPFGLPFLVYCWFPLVAVVAMLLLTWLFYDAVVVKISADEVLSRLQSRTSGYYGTLRDKPAEKREFMRRCRALQPIRLTIGDFTEFTLGVVMNIWEEVLNQLLFLLSL